MITEKHTPISRALIAASQMPAPQARRVLMLICESGMTMSEDVPKPVEPTEGEKHYAKREKFIRRMKSSTDRVLNYARHETLRKIEKHFRENPSISAAESGDATPTTEPSSLAVRLTFDKELLSIELLAALREDQEAALSTAGQQLFDEIGKDSVWRIPSQDAIQFVQDRANLLVNVPDEVHTEIMQSIEQGLQAGESRKELMARISAAFDEIGRGRAETIANTETAAAFNYARDKAMREAGVTHKKWLHSMSPLIKEPRPTHLEADGQTVPIDDPFDVGGVQFMRPADDSLGAGPEDIINCHCVAIPVEAPIKSEDAGHPFRGNQYTGGIDDPSASEQTRFKPKSKVQFSPPIVGPNGRKLTHYEWQSRLSSQVDKEGEEQIKRVSDWEKSVESGHTGRDLVHQFTIETPTGEKQIVSAESVPAMLGHGSDAPHIKSVVNSSKNLAQLHMKLAAMEAETEGRAFKYNSLNISLVKKQIEKAKSKLGVQ